MELRVLRYFMTIAREGSITSAANVLHVTQPTLSRQIRDLENELGQKLFIRGSHHMTLTAEGMVLRKRAEEILSMVDKTEAEFHAMESTVSGDIYIGSGETQAIQHIAEIAKEIREDHPGIHLMHMEHLAERGPMRIDMRHMSEEKIREVEDLLFSTERPVQERFFKGRGVDFRTG